MDLVVVAAARFELEPLVNALQARGLTPEARTVGVGAINAAKNARQVAEACRGASVIFVGTCGVFSEFRKVHLVRVDRVVWSPTAVRAGLAYTVKESAPPILLPKAPAWAQSLPVRTAVCSPAISLIATLPDGLTPAETVENLELYSCIGEIAQTAASLAVVLGVTNAVGPDSHTQWRQNFAVAAGLTAEYIGANLPSEAPGRAARPKAKT